MTLKDGLISYYKLDGNSTDSLSVNNGTDSNITYTGGKINQCASFNGSASINTNSKFSFINTSGLFTINLWMKFNNFNSGSQFFMGNNPGNVSSGFYLGNSSGNLSVYLHPTSPASINGVFTDNNWNMLTLTSDATTVYVYKNGNLFGTAPFTLNISVCPNNVTLGQINTFNSSRLNGFMDEVGFWSRRLSDSEVAKIYNAGGGLSYPFQTSNFLPFFLK